MNVPVDSELVAARKAMDEAERACLAAAALHDAAKADFAAACERFVDFRREHERRTSLAIDEAGGVEHPGFRRTNHP